MNMFSLSASLTDALYLHWTERHYNSTEQLQYIYMHCMNNYITSGEGTKDMFCQYFCNKTTLLRCYSNYKNINIIIIMTPLACWSYSCIVSAITTTFKKLRHYWFLQYLDTCCSQRPPHWQDKSIDSNPIENGNQSGWRNNKACHIYRCLGFFLFSLVLSKFPLILISGGVDH